MAKRDQSRVDRTLFLNVSEARCLPANESTGSCDPYCSIKLGDTEYRTRTILKSTEPSWGEEFVIPVTNPNDELIITLWDESRRSKDEPLGQVTIPLGSLADHRQHEQWHRIFPNSVKQLDVVEGEIELRLTVTSSTLTVGILRARSLAAKDANGFSNPYVKLKYGGERYKTKIILKNLDPVWNEECTFKLAEGNPPLQVVVWDWDKLSSDDFIGQVEVDVSQFPSGRAVTQWFRLGPRPPKPQRGIDVPMAGERPHGDLRLKLKYTEEVLLPLSSYNPLLRLLTEPTLAIASTLGNVTRERADVARILVKIFESPQAGGASINLLKLLTSYEIDSQCEPSTIFRGNSLATKALDMYMKLIGRSYLRSTLQPLIEAVYTSKKDYEVDPMKASKKADLARNAKNLRELAEAVLDRIFNSLDQCPTRMRLIFQHLQWKVQQRFPAAETVRYTVVAGFIFLRFFNPAIIAPKLFDLAPAHPPEHAARTLTLLAKVTQNLANLITFGDKEPYMKEINEVILRNKDKMKNFLDEIASAGEGTEGDVPDIDIQKELGLLVRHLLSSYNDMVEATKEKPEDALIMKQLGEALQTLQTEIDTAQASLFSRAV